ncbi:Hypothetical protein SRAE_1000297800 [Strongyloides ratti]|uniref:Peptidase_S9 domain-containing protein n=1 Tax=Strongyloides ratti TaxID=34506 RepID=A0A090LB61_STRRB|nr:Hypothetical protein SRAE_1000297800 [Strongyloides ratti]CEF64725.1 Hypothetical protein SRAE_1000297800 [Strongyloides ratti]
MLEGDNFTEFTESILQKCSCSFTHHYSSSIEGTFICEEDKKVSDILSVVTSDTDYKKLSILSTKFNTFNYNVPKRKIILTKKDEKFLKQLKYLKKNSKCSCKEIKNNFINNNSINLGCVNGKHILENIKKSIQMKVKKYFDSDMLCQKVWKSPPNKYYLVKNLDNYHDNSNTTNSFLKNTSYKMIPEHYPECSFSYIKHFLISTSKNDVIAGSYVLMNSNPKYTIIYSHTEDTNLYHHTNIFPHIQNVAEFLNVNFVTYDYSGYGMTSGTPSIENLQNNLKTIINYVNTQLGIEKDKIILWGSSLGGTLSANITVSETDISGLILFETPNTMLEHLCYKDKFYNNQKYKKYSKYKKDFNTCEAVSKINVPILIVRNQLATNVSYSTSFEIYKAAANVSFCHTVFSKKNTNFLHNSEALLRVKGFLEYDINLKNISNTLNQ